MSYLSKLVTLYGKTPIWLVELTRGATIYRFHMGKGSVTFDSETYTESALTFDSLNYSADARKDDFTIDNFALSDATTQALIAAGRVPLSLRVIRGFQGDAEFIVTYLGKLSNIRIKDRTVSLVFSSWAEDLEKRGAGQVAQRQCPFMLYSEDCGVSEAAFTVASTATAYVDGVATVTSASSEADGYYVGGKIEYDGEERRIEKHVGTALTLSSAFPELSAEVTLSGTASVNIKAGCDKSATTCRDRFSNIASHGGFIAMTDDPMNKLIF